VSVPPFVGDDNFVIGIVVVCPCDNEVAGGDEGEGAHAAWDVWAGVGEHGEAEPQGDEEGDDDGVEMHLVGCGGEVFGWCVGWYWVGSSGWLVVSLSCFGFGCKMFL